MSPRGNIDPTASPSTPTTGSGRPLSRRAVVAGGGTAALVSLAGCSTIVNRLAEMALKEINVFNGADRRVSGTIEVVDPNGEVVLEEAFDLEAESQSGEDETNDATTAQYSDVWTDAGDYEVGIELDEALAADSGTVGNETDESVDNSSDADNSSETGTSADDESADDASDSGTDAEGSEPGSSATETVTVAAPDEEHLVVGIGQDETDESISFHVIEEFSELGEEFEWLPLSTGRSVITGFVRWQRPLGRRNWETSSHNDSIARRPDYRYATVRQCRSPG